MSYEQDMYIDESALDVELVEQPTLMARYSRLLAEARRDKDLSKEALELIKAEIDLDIRDHPDKYNLVKVTENAIGNCILMEDDYKKAQKAYHDANYEVNVLQGVVSALEHRKSALENMVKLYGQNYFAGPAVPHDLTALRKERGDETSHRIGKSMKRATNSKDKENDKKEE